MLHIINIFSGCFFSDGGHAAGAETAGDLSSDVETVGGEGFVEGLGICVDGPE